MNRTASPSSPARRPSSRLVESSVAAVLSLVLLIGLGPILDHAGFAGTQQVDAATGPHMIATAADIAKLPTSGVAWTNLKKAADESAGTPDLSNQDSNNDVLVLAKALVYARTKIASYRTTVLTNLKAVVGTEVGGRSISVGRGLPAYIIAADLISLPTYQPTFDAGTFKPWLRKLLSEDLQGDTLVSTHNLRPNNWGTHAGAARIAIAIYLGDALQLKRAATVFHGFLGDRASYHGFDFGADLSWQCSVTAPVGIDAGCVKNGINLDGAIPDEMRRGASLQWPPVPTSYPWELMQGAVLQAELLQRAGYAAWSWSNKALLRAARFLYRAGWPADANDDWQPWLLDYRYGTTFRKAGATHFGKNYGWSDWLYGAKVSGSPGWRSYSDAKVVYHKAWFRSSSARYLGGWVHSSRTRAAKAVFRFYGDQVAWIGPKGPAFGRAAVYVDGHLIRTINLHTAIKHYRVKLFTAIFGKPGTHYLTVKVMGTPGHPLVSIDGYRVHR